MKFIPSNVREVNLPIGGVFASDRPTIVRTVLGSCIAVCLFDSVVKVGGMNHFMLPSGLEEVRLPTRFGVHAMEVLINRLMRRGAERRRLQAKIFGGADVLPIRGNCFKVAEKNRRFINEFLETEGIPLVAHRLGGANPMQVYFFTHTARAMVRSLQRMNINHVLELESRYRAKLMEESMRPAADNVTLFCNEDRGERLK